MIVWQGFAETPDQPGDYWHDTIAQDLLALLPEWFEPNILVTPGHFRDHNVSDVQRYVQGAPWIVWVLGDEEGASPWWHLDAPVWKQFPNPHRAYWPDHVLPLGYTPHTRPTLTGLGIPLKGQGRWVLAGQDTNRRRHDAFRALQDIKAEWCHPSPTFAGGIDPEAYIRLLWEADWAPSPAGNVRADSFRMWEALEAGAVPIIDATTPHGDRNVWSEMLGDHPLPVVYDWSDVGKILESPAPMAEVGAWYTRYKRGLVNQLVSDWRDLTGDDRWDPPRVRITSVITASPLPSHPDFSILAKTVESVRAQLPNEIIIAFDGPRDTDNRDTYEEHIRRVAYHANHHWPEVQIHYTGRWKHQAGTLKDVVPTVSSDCLLVLEADTPILGDIPWDTIVSKLYTEEFHHIRLHYDHAIHPEHEYLMRGRQGKFIKTVQYSQRPHLVRKDFYSDLLGIVPANARTYVEDCVYGAIANSPWEHNKLAIYAPGPEMKRSDHLDGRGGIDKGEFWW